MDIPILFNQLIEPFSPILFHNFLLTLPITFSPFCLTFPLILYSSSFSKVNISNIHVWMFTFPCNEVLEPRIEQRLHGREAQSVQSFFPDSLTSQLLKILQLNLPLLIPSPSHPSVYTSIPPQNITSSKYHPALINRFWLFS